MKNSKISKIFFLPLAFLLMAISFPSEPDCALEADFFFGISSIEKVPGWSQFCNFEAGDKWFNPFGDMVNIESLVQDSYGGFGSINPWNWWIEGGWGDGTFCFDDDTNPSGGIRCLEGTTTAANCPLNIYVLVVGECDDCVNFSTGGTWYKSEFTMDPDDIGLACGFGVNMTRLQLEPRTNCTDMSKSWGCGPNEFQD